MGILGITNRTENWKTARYFAPFFESCSARADLVMQLHEPLGEVEPRTVKVELFWKGMRDHLNLPDGGAESNSQRQQQELADRYRCLFPNLRDEISQFNGLTLPNDWNYDVSEGAEEKTLEELEEGLFNNLRNTEIDIVLQTDQYLFIGEAKHLSGFGRDGKLILVHQLIRQYVMSTILTDMVAEDNKTEPKRIIPFVVGDDINKLKNYQQVEFMIQQHNGNRSPGEWLKEENILNWDCIEELASSGDNNG